MKKPVSRIDSGNTHGWFARVYRDKWVGSRSFADRKCGSREQAETDAWQWVKIANERLPQVPPKPVRRRATVYVRRDPKNPGSSYYEVYLPPLDSETSWSRKYYFTTLDGQKKQRQEANDLADQRNKALKERYEQELAAWHQERDKIMRQVLEIWEEVKNHKIG